MTGLLSFATRSALLQPTSRFTTHALVLHLDYVPSLPLYFKVRTFEVLPKAELPATSEHDGGMPELPRWNQPGPDRRAVVMAGQIRQMMPFTVDVRELAEFQSGRIELPPMEVFVRAMSEPGPQSQLKNKEQGEII
ncbi:hypothetical protein FOA52_012100 [Chlamydomonas sp. UWO 241]|nr:hypothetical protein FOA52_012100 [Chlamydomonas sp. UWO 241]